ncbi:choice-of-anchor P family protein, partial [Kitasatospora sp. NPDC002227]|uniref:choice-of-anchor P family protein n=1 Tax=Kitasatospora sp. NPDC002227 TaxID=3154773 RepID=UPI00331C2E8B
LSRPSTSPSTVASPSAAGNSHNTRYTSRWTHPNPAAGSSFASARVERLGARLGPLLGGLALTGVRSTCRATPDGATGNGTIAGGTVTLPFPLPSVSLAADAAPNTGVSLPLVGTVLLNEQTRDARGVLTVNALHLTLLPVLGGTDVIIGHARCGGAAPVVPVPIADPQILTGAAALAITVTVLRRRRSGISSSTRPSGSAICSGPWTEAARTILLETGGNTHDPVRGDRRSDPNRRSSRSRQG